MVLHSLEIRRIVLESSEPDPCILRIQGRNYVFQNTCQFISEDEMRSNVIIKGGFHDMDQMYCVWMFVNRIGDIVFNHIWILRLLLFQTHYTEDRNWSCQLQGQFNRYLDVGITDQRHKPTLWILFVLQILLDCRDDNSNTTPWSARRNTPSPNRQELLELTCWFISLLASKTSHRPCLCPLQPRLHLFHLRAQACLRRHLLLPPQR